MKSYNDKTSEQETIRAIRTKKGQFKPGTSGNPGGRPKSIEALQEVARSYTSQALEVLISVANNPRSPASARVSASCALLDRAWGKPCQNISPEAEAQKNIQPVIIFGNKPKDNI